jgi:hypothetical protein
MCAKTIETPPLGEAASGGQQLAVGDGAPSKEERIDFLKQAIAFTEWNIRSFDTKAQISIAAFVLSMNICASGVEFGRHSPAAVIRDDRPALRLRHLARHTEGVQAEWQLGNERAVLCGRPEPADR